MNRSLFRSGLFVFASVLLLTGCATTRAKKPESTDLANQVTQLQNEVQAKDQQIQDLQYQIQNAQQPVYSSNVSGTKSKLIKVAGVTVTDVQRALAKAGYDPGPVDGHAGKKTKKAIKSFQRANKLSADGVVGEKTWARLNR